MAAIEWIEIPNTNGQLLHVPTGRYMHIAAFAKFKEGKCLQREAPDVLVKCHDVWRGGFRRDVVLKHSHTWTQFYELLEDEFGEKVVFDYQDRGGRLVRVDDVERFERFCQAVDDASSTRTNSDRQYGTEIDVYIRPYNPKQQEAVKGGMLEQRPNSQGTTPKPTDKGDDTANGGKGKKGKCTRCYTCNCGRRYSCKS